MAALDRNRFIALFWLAVTFWAHLFSKLRARLSRTVPRPIDVFRDNYRRDGIWSLDPDDRAALPSLGECIACGLCDPVCPPMHAEAGRGFVGPSRLVSGSYRDLPAVSSWIDPFLCIRCRACDDACPQGVAIDRLVGSMRRAVAREAPELVPAGLREACDRLVATGHLSAQAPDAPRRVRGAKSDYIYVASCAASRRDVEVETALLSAAGLDFSSAPPLCCGAFGENALGESPLGLRDELVRSRALHVVTADPRCREHMRRSPLYGGLEVLHLLEVVDLGGASEQPVRVTYHDPCSLVREASGVELPRAAIRRAGGDLIEMRRSGRDAPCCGMAGGAHTWNPALAEELGRARIRDAASTGAPVLLTASSLCRDHLARCAALEGAPLEVASVYTFLAERSGASPPARDHDAAPSAPVEDDRSAAGLGAARGESPSGAAAGGKA